MSRIGKLPIPIPDNVQVDIDGKRVRAKGPKGELERRFNGVHFDQADGEVRVFPDASANYHRAQWGLSRTLLANMVKGVSEGFTRELVIAGVGYRAEEQGDTVRFTLGYSHPIDFEVPEGLEISVEKQAHVKVHGTDKERVGQTAARIRALRPPEPYKGKGIAYANETIRRKAGKSGK